MAAAGWTLLGVVLWRFVRFRDASAVDDEPHFRIDEGGLHWRDSTGGMHLFPASRVRTFRIGLDEDTERPVAALTLQLADGQETQPIELEPPADAPAVRRFLTERWRIEPGRGDDADRYAGYLRQRLHERERSPVVRRLARWALAEPWHERGEWLLADLPGRGKLFFDEATGLWIWEDFRDESIRERDLDALLDRLPERMQAEPSDREGGDAATAILRSAELPGELKAGDARRRFLAWFADQWENELPGDASDLVLRTERSDSRGYLVDGEWHGEESWFFQGAYDPARPTDPGWLTISRFSEVERSQQAFQRAAKSLGMLVRFQTSDGQWQFIGSRDAFAEWTEWIASHAPAMKPREPGVRMPSFVWGADPIRIVMQYSPIPFVEDGRLAGPEDFFDSLAANLREMLRTWPDGKEAQVQLFPRRDPPFLLSFRERRIDALAGEAEA